MNVAALCDVVSFVVYRMIRAGHDPAAAQSTEQCAGAGSEEVRRKIRGADIHHKADVPSDPGKYGEKTEQNLRSKAKVPSNSGK